MNKKAFLVITSIANQENKVLQTYGSYCHLNHIPFILIGDSKSPDVFKINGCEFFGIPEQKELPFISANLIPEKHYARKNIGYLIAAKRGAEIIIETDDDNFPMAEFWNDREISPESVLIENAAWLNIYNYFTKEMIWPRGFAIEHLNDILPHLDNFQTLETICPIQQGLANENPDVDAIYRLILRLPFNFDSNRNVSIGQNTWCPFNSQNTTWFREAFLLLYLPSYCSFRMTDIWRSFVAQRICWENGWNILFHKATVWQERNNHDLLKDFEDEIPGYLNNKKITDTLSGLHLLKGKENINLNLIKCYQSLVELNLVDQMELNLLEAWISDMANILLNWV